MDEDKLHNQIPILRFLNRHKWRIILPTLLFFPYWMLPFYSGKSYPPSQSYLYVTSAQNASPEALNEVVAKVSDQLQSDESILGLIKTYDLFAKDRRQGLSEDQLIWKMRGSMVIGPESTKPPGGVNIYVWVRLLNEVPEKTTAISDEIARSFESRSDLSVTRTIVPTAPRPSVPSIALMILIGAPGMFSSLILIFIWEIPFLFYSKKTQEMVFDPIRSDWRDEKIEAKVHGNIGDVIAVNVRYSFAFIGAMLAKSPIGELFEFVGKVAR